MTNTEMTPLEALDIIDDENITLAKEATYLKAWQYLVDTGLAWKLEGRIGRQAAHLINAGFINAPANWETK